ncbi:4454_t:CDS:2, partial [Dentiscutata heterogama]
GIEKIKYPTDKNKPYDLAIGKKLDDISNIENCEIFTTVMKEHNRHIFSSYVAYDAPDAPVIFIQRYPEDSFDFDLSNQVRYKSGKYGNSSDVSITNPYTINNISHKAEWPNEKIFVLSSCILDKTAYSNSESRPRESKLVFGSHFSLSKNRARLFAYSSEHYNKLITHNDNDYHFLQHMKLCICTIYMENFERNMHEKEVKWKYMNRKDKIFYSKLKGINTDENEKLIFASQLFENPECNHHEVINIALGSPDYLLRGPLTKSDFKKSKLDILYLNYSQEKDHMYL